MDSTESFFQSTTDMNIDHSPTESLVFNHLQLTLQAQTDLLKHNQESNQFLQFLNEDEYSPFYSQPPQNYSSMMDLHQQAMNYATCFSNNNNNINHSEQDTQLLYHPLSSPDFTSNNEYLPYDFYNFDINYDFDLPVEPEDRKNSTPMLSASFSFSSFSSASSSETNNIMTTSPIKKKSASISYIPELTKRKLARKLKQKSSPHHKKLDTVKSRSMSFSSSSMKKGRNVDKACNHCKKSHLRCDNVRPCRRCVATGKIGCQDVLHKPRGRPRIQKKD